MQQSLLPFSGHYSGVNITNDKIAVYIIICKSILRTCDKNICTNLHGDEIAPSPWH